MLDRYGKDIVDQAITQALSAGAIGSAAVAHLCDKLQRQTGAPPPVASLEHHDPKVRDLTVIPHDLATYDALFIEEQSDSSEETS